MLAWVRQLIGFIVRLLKWAVWDARWFWIVALVPIALFLFWWAAHPAWEPRIRLTGMCLELSGLVTVAVGIHETTTLFNHPGLLAVFRAWGSAFPAFRPEPVVIRGAAMMAESGDMGTAFGSVGLSTTHTLDRRVAALEERLGKALQQIQQTQSRIDEEARSRADASKAERQEREAGDRKNQELIEKAKAGGVYLEWMGVLWLGLGIVLAGASNEIASCLGLG